MIESFCERFDSTTRTWIRTGEQAFFGSSKAYLLARHQEKLTQRMPVSPRKRISDLSKALIFSVTIGAGFFALTLLSLTPIVIGYVALIFASLSAIKSLIKLKFNRINVVKEGYAMLKLTTVGALLGGALLLITLLPMPIFASMIVALGVFALGASKYAKGFKQKIFMVTLSAASLATFAVLPLFSVGMLPMLLIGLSLALGLLLTSFQCAQTSFKLQKQGMQIQSTTSPCTASTSLSSRTDSMLEYSTDASINTNEDEMGSNPESDNRGPTQAQS